MKVFSKKDSVKSDSTIGNTQTASKSVVRVIDDHQTILDEAKLLVYGDRTQDYGHPAHDYERVAKIWSGIIGVEVTALQAIQCMIGVKLSRITNTPDHHDSWVDIAGYAECGNRIVEYLKDK